MRSSTGHLSHAGEGDRLFHHVADGVRGHVRFQIAGQHEARVIIEHFDRVIPAPTHHEVVTGIGLPHLIRCRRLHAKLLARRKAHQRDGSIEPMPLQHPIHGGFRHREPGVVGDMTGQFARAQIGLLQRGFQDRGLLFGPQPVPHCARFRLAIHESRFALVAIAPLPTIERRTRHPQLGDRRSLRLRRTPHQLNHLPLLLRTHPLVPPPPDQP